MAEGGACSNVQASYETELRDIISSLEPHRSALDTAQESPIQNSIPSADQAIKVGDKEEKTDQSSPNAQQIIPGFQTCAKLPQTRDAIGNWDGYEVPVDDETRPPDVNQTTEAVTRSKSQKAKGKYSYVRDTDARKMATAKKKYPTTPIPPVWIPRPSPSAKTPDVKPKRKEASETSSDDDHEYSEIEDASTPSDSTSGSSSTEDETPNHEYEHPIIDPNEESSEPDSNYARRNYQILIFPQNQSRRCLRVLGYIALIISFVVVVSGIIGMLWRFDVIGRK